MPTSVVAGKRWRCACGCREIEVHQKVVKVMIVHSYPDNGDPPVLSGGQIVGVPETPHLFRCASCHVIIAENVEALWEAARDGNAARWQRPLVTADDVQIDRTMLQQQRRPTLLPTGEDANDVAGAVLQFIQPAPHRIQPPVPTIRGMTDRRNFNALDELIVEAEQDAQDTQTMLGTQDEQEPPVEGEPPLEDTEEPTR